MTAVQSTSGSWVWQAWLLLLMQHSVVHPTTTYTLLLFNCYLSYQQVTVLSTDFSCCKAYSSEESIILSYIHFFLLCGLKKIRQRIVYTSIWLWEDPYTLVHDPQTVSANYLVPWESATVGSCGDWHNLLSQSKSLNERFRYVDHCFNT